MHYQACENVESGACCNVGKISNGRLDGIQMLDLLVATHRQPPRPKARMCETDKRLMNHSKLCNVAHDNRTMAQIAENVEFFHNELGISAGFFLASCTCIQSTNSGIVANDMINSNMFAGFMIFIKFPDICLRRISDAHTKQVRI